MTRRSVLRWNALGYDEVSLNSRRGCRIFFLPLDS